MGVEGTSRCTGPSTASAKPGRLLGLFHCGRTRKRSGAEGRGAEGVVRGRCYLYSSKTPGREKRAEEDAKGEEERVWPFVMIMMGNEWRGGGAPKPSRIPRYPTRGPPVAPIPNSRRTKEERVGERAILLPGGAREPPPQHGGALPCWLGAVQ
jgi:hypothetical protein